VAKVGVKRETYLSTDAVEEVLAQYRPRYQMDGGDLILLAIKNGVVYLDFRGPCIGCALSSLTVQYGIEKALRERFPGFRGIVSNVYSSAEV